MERQAERAGAPVSQAFAWHTNQLAEERSGGYGMNLSLIGGLKTADRRITLLDCPGRRKYCKNAITGASQSDVALLCVAVDDHSAALDHRGEARQHAMLAFALGVPAVVVAVTKVSSGGRSAVPRCARRKPPAS